MEVKHSCSDCVHRKDSLVPCDWLVRQDHIVVYCPHYEKENPWKRINDQLSELCKNGDPCHEKAPRGSRTGTQGLNGSKERSVIPLELCRHIVKICEEA